MGNFLKLRGCCIGESVVLYSWKNILYLVNLVRDIDMQKIKTTVHIAGKDYAISSYDSVEHVQGVAAWVDRRMKELHQATKLPGGQLAVLTAMNAADDMVKSREEIRRLRLELEEARKEIERLSRNAKA